MVRTAIHLLVMVNVVLAFRAPSPGSCTYKDAAVGARRLDAWGRVRPLRAVEQATAPAGDMVPAQVRQLLTEMERSDAPQDLRDVVKKLSEVEGLDELYFDDNARQVVNQELKDYQRARPDLWVPEAQYYGGIVRRTVNPYHIIELKPLLKVGPFVGGLGYLLAIVVQRKAPKFFAVAYFTAVASIVVPAAYLILG